jgi:protein associated with RNAse G/E
MTFTMLKLKCPNCKEKFIIHRKEYKRNAKNVKRPKNLNKLFLHQVKQALRNPKQTGIVFTKVHYEIEK